MQKKHKTKKKEQPQLTSDVYGSIKENIKGEKAKNNYYNGEHITSGKCAVGI